MPPRAGPQRGQGPEEPFVLGEGRTRQRKQVNNVPFRVAETVHRPGNSFDSISARTWLMLSRPRRFLSQPRLPRLAKYMRMFSELCTQVPSETVGEEEGDSALFVHPPLRARAHALGRTSRSGAVCRGDASGSERHPQGAAQERSVGTHGLGPRATPTRGGRALAERRGPPAPTRCPPGCPRPAQ